MFFKTPLNCIISLAIIILCLRRTCAALNNSIKYRDRHRLGVLLDAGSVGTKLRIFSWPFRNNTDSIPHIRIIYTEKFEPKLDTFSNRPHDLRFHLLNMIKKIKNLVPKKMYKHTPIYIFLTAGARFLDASESLQILESMRKTLSNRKDNPFLFRRHFARILSGEEEGGYCWIAVNYLQNNFKDNTPDKKLVGILEMGGGSTQIAFKPRVPIYANKFNIHLKNRNYGIYAHSHLYYGQYYMELRINRHLMAKLNPFQEPVNPCMLKGDVISFTHNNRSVLIKGGGDWRRCESILHHFLQSSPDNMCYPKPCSIGDVYRPKIPEDEIFYAIAGFAYNAKDLDVIDSGNSINLYMMRGKAISYCNKTIQTVMETTNIPHQYLSSLCMMGLYIPMLLTQAYGFSPFTKNIIAATDINKQEISWSLGAMINEMQYLPVMKVEKPKQSTAKLPDHCIYTIYFGIITVYLHIS